MDMSGFGLDCGGDDDEQDLSDLSGRGWAGAKPVRRELALDLAGTGGAEEGMQHESMRSLGSRPLLPRDAR